jgi:hypothetical protein
MKRTKKKSARPVDASKSSFVEKYPPQGRRKGAMFIPTHVPSTWPTPPKVDVGRIVFNPKPNK